MFRVLGFRVFTVLGLIVECFRFRGLGFRVCGLGFKGLQMFRTHRHTGRVLWCAPTLSASSQPAHPHLNLGGCWVFPWPFKRPCKLFYVPIRAPSGRKSLQSKGPGNACVLDSRWASQSNVKARGLMRLHSALLFDGITVNSIQKVQAMPPVWIAHPSQTKDSAQRVTLHEHECRRHTRFIGLSHTCALDGLHHLEKKRIHAMFQTGISMKCKSPA